MSNKKNFTHQSNVFFGCTLLSRDFCAYVQRVNLPGINFSNIEMTKTAVKFFTQGDTPTYNTLTLDIILDEKLIIWRELIENFQKMSKNGVGDNTPLEFDSWIHIFNERDESILKILYKNCYLQNIGDIDYDATGEDSELTLSISIDYSYFEFEKLPKEKQKHIIEGYRKNTFIKHIKE